jgi:hypothetical protein
MTIGQLRTVILLGNLGAVTALLGVGGKFLWRKVVVGPPRVKVVKIPHPKVDASAQRKTARREDYRNAWTLPLVPDQQPRAKRVTNTTEEGPSGMTAAKLRQKLAETFELRLCSPDYADPGNFSFAALTLRRPVPGKPNSVVVKLNETHLGMEVVDITPVAVIFEYERVQAPLDFVGNGKGNIFDDGGSSGGGGGGANQFDSTPVSSEPSGSYGWIEKAKKVTDKGGLVVWEVSKEEQQYLRRNYQRLVSEVVAVPHVGKNGKVDGIELKQIEKTSIVYKRGFQDRDVVKSINGEPVTDMSKLPGMFRKHRDSGEITIVYERRGVQRTTTYKVPQK